MIQLVFAEVGWQVQHAPDGGKVLILVDAQSGMTGIYVAQRLPDNGGGP